MPARASKLRNIAGRMVSAKSKTGDPLCSSAMSAFQLLLRGATAAVSMTKEQASKILGQCRSKARLARQGQLARSAGKEALAQHLEARASRGGPLSAKDRLAKARELKATRAASSAPARVAPDSPAAARRLAEIRAKNRAAKAAPATIGGEKPGERFTLRTRAASVAPGSTPQNLGRGKTPFMFDMKRGDKPGQLSIMDRVGSVDTRPLHAQALEAARKVPAHLRTGEKVFIHHAWREYRKSGGELTLDQFKRGLMESAEGRMMTSRADLVQGMRPGDVKGSRALWMGTEHNFIRTGLPGGSGPSPRANYWGPIPAGERGKAAALVAKTRAGRAKAAGKVKTQRARMAAAARDVHRATGRPMKSIDQAIGIARHRAAQARTREDVVEAHRWNQHEAALQAHKVGRRAPKAGGWNRAPESERPAAAALVSKVRAGRLASVKRRDLAPLGDRVEQLQRVPEKQAMAGRRSKTAAAIKEARGKLKRYEDVATHGKAGDTGYVPTDALNFDPGRFQYKQAAQGKHGVTDQFAETKKWNPELAGVISAWRDPADGKLYVVNGHHRADLARRLGVDKLRVQLLNARDASEARAKGAIENIGEGRGTAYDAAKFLREQKLADRASLEQFGVSLSEAKAKQGLALAGLHPKLWKDYEAGAMPEERAAMIGGSGLNHAQQESLAKSLKRGTSNATLRELIDNAHAAGKVKQQTRDLFGTSEEEVSLAHHRAAAQAHVRETLLADNRLYGLVSKAKSAASIEERGAGRIEQEKAGAISQQSRELLDVFDRLKNRSGPVAAALSDAQERLHAGHPKKAVYSDLRRRILAEMERVLRGGKEAFAA